MMKQLANLTGKQKEQKNKQAPAKKTSKQASGKSTRKSAAPPKRSSRGKKVTSDDEE
jgi:hypothetical protein